MIDPQDNTQFKKDIAEGFAKMKERRREKANVWPKSEGEQPLVSMAQIAEEMFKVPDIVDVEVKVPLIKNGRPFFNLNKRFIEKALREGKIMRITWPDGSALHKPEEWLKGEPYQKEFKFPAQPLSMIGNFLDLE